MTTIAKLFVRAKHWYIFLAFIVFSLATAFLTGPDGAADMAIAGLATCIFMLFFVGWLWSMGRFLNSLLPDRLKLREGFFQFACIYPLLYVPVFLALFVLSLRTNPSNIIFVFPFHLFAVFCMFYLLYFVSKSLVLVENGRAATFYEYAGPFFLLWFFPVGVWVTQPRINRLFAGTVKDSLAAG
ncbi:MAG TPA: hypothetical protein VN517_14125 [Terriglobales bacterium]|jgi:hypothetical protein|nr:hypothetical protein [Terriglobales bacterium]